MKLTDARIGKLDQGTIFTCARAERYRNQHVYGLVITARCDIDQAKFPVLNYIPVVTLDDWLMVDGLDIIRDRAEKEALGKIRNFLKAQSVAESVLISQSLRELLSTTFADLKKKEREKFEDLIGDYDLASSGFSMDHAGFFARFESLKSGVIDELIKHKVGGYYFLPSVYPGEARDGYVALLREATFVPRNLAMLIAEGLEQSRFEKDAALSTTNCLSFSRDDFAMPISQIPSPEIEHLLQSFSLMFGRIGLDDPDPELVSVLRQRIPNRAGVTK
ncbi:hypothetical protein ELG79_09065 [Rhizobium leguminosarum]|uniref:hypothetical protein n=1 Tax=Rhizobium leguminosarum TaxID=384 RepID=UPI00103147B4|nr:hypothetical protein [Rhizobium leguminosarum]TBG25392.1 hypothetical protein ELG79_09065 [Rhizobium leguminosarum]